MFWKVEGAAWRRYAALSNLRTSDTAEHDRFRHEQLAAATGGRVTSSKDIQTSKDFEAVMLALATIANDPQEIERWTAQPERRMRWLTEQALKRLEWVTGQPHDWTYVQGIFAHMRLPATLADCPAELAQKVFVALETHLARYFKDACCRPVDAQRAHALGAPWLSDAADRHAHPLWERAMVQNADTTPHRPAYDHHKPRRKHHADQRGFYAR